MISAKDQTVSKKCHKNLERHKKDSRPWNEIMNEYFFIRDYHKDFKMEFQKFIEDDAKQDWFEKTI